MFHQEIKKIAAHYHKDETKSTELYEKKLMAKWQNIRTYDQGEKNNQQIKTPRRFAAQKFFLACYLPVIYDYPADKLFCYPADKIFCCQGTEQLVVNFSLMIFKDSTHHHYIHLVSVIITQARVVGRYHFQGPIITDFISVTEFL